MEIIFEKEKFSSAKSFNAAARPTSVRNVCGSFCLYHRQPKWHYLSVVQNVCGTECLWTECLCRQKGQDKMSEAHRHFGLHLLSVKNGFICLRAKMSVGQIVCELVMTTDNLSHRQFVPTDSLSRNLKTHQIKYLKIRKIITQLKLHRFFFVSFYGLFSFKS